VTYDPIKKALVVPLKDVDSAARKLRLAIAKLRKQGGLSLSGYREMEVPLGDAVMGEIFLLEAAAVLGIEMGAERPGELDVSTRE
jgi:hypothetical protein